MKKLMIMALVMALSMPVFGQTGETVASGVVSTDMTAIQSEPDVPVMAVPAVKDPKWSVKATAGYFPTIPVVIDLFGGIFVGVAIGLNKDANETLEFSLPPYAAIEALYDFNETWSAGISAGYLGTAFKVVDKDTRAVKSVSYINLLPLTLEGRCNYLNRPAVRLYGSLEAGAIFSMESGKLNVVPEVQLNPFGVEFGRRLFGVFELGVGMNYTGCRAGLGYRF